MINRSLTLLAVGLAACAGASASTPTPASTSAPRPTPPPAPAVAPPVTPLPPMPTPSPSAVDPAGSYDLRVTFGGSSTSATMELYKENGAWRGTVGIPNVGAAEVTNVVVDGRKFRVTMYAQNGMAFNLNFELHADNTVAGNWDGGGDGSPVTGRKIR